MSRQSPDLSLSSSSQCSHLVKPWLGKMNRFVQHRGLHFVGERLHRGESRENCQCGRCRVDGRMLLNGIVNTPQQIHLQSVVHAAGLIEGQQNFDGNKRAEVFFQPLIVLHDATVVREQSLNANGCLKPGKSGNSCQHDSEQE